jgi:ABC-type transporter Mla MlaB component
MEFCRISYEAHRTCATIYIAGVLADMAAARAEEIVRALPLGTQVVRLDLRAVDLIDPDSFARIAGALNRWRDARRTRITIEFPLRSLRRTHLRLFPLDHPANRGMAVSTAMS